MAMGQSHTFWKATHSLGPHADTQKCRSDGRTQVIWSMKMARWSTSWRYELPAKKNDSAAYGLHLAEKTNGTVSLLTSAYPRLVEDRLPLAGFKVTKK